ncbi:MAG: TRAP transporter substrate-binding protein [Clostridiales bacterium]|nr:TRAP transporter substrate-binding protein [Clostridiales bacterium]
MKALRFKKISALLLVLLLLVSLGACSSGGNGGEGEEQQSDEVIVLRWSNTATYPSQPNVIMREFKKVLEEKTDRIKVQLYEAGSYGGPNEMVQALQSGTMHVVTFPAGFFATVAPDITVLDIPFLFKDPEEANDILNGETPALDEYLHSQGLDAVCWIYESGKDILLNKEVKSLADLKGLNIRTYSSPASQDEITALGAVPIMLSSADVAMGLQQGTIDGVHCGNTFSVPAKLYELTDYYLKAPGTQNPIPVMFSKTFLDNLPDDLRELLLTTVKEIVLGMGNEYAVQYVNECYDTLEAADIKIIEPTPQLLAEMEEATAGIAEKYTSKSENIAKIYNELVQLRDANR